MTLRTRLLKATQVMLEAEDISVTTDEPVNTKPRRLSDGDVDDFMLAAENRDDPLWDEIYGYLRGELRRQFPFRANRIERDLRWMRKRAAKAGLDWGRR